MIAGEEEEEEEGEEGERRPVLPPLLSVCDRCKCIDTLRRLRRTVMTRVASSVACSPVRTRSEAITSDQQSAPLLMSVRQLVSRAPTTTVHSDRRHQRLIASLLLLLLVLQRQQQQQLLFVLLCFTFGPQYQGIGPSSCRLDSATCTFRGKLDENSIDLSPSLSVPSYHLEGHAFPCECSFQSFHMYIQLAALLIGTDVADVVRLALSPRRMHTNLSLSLSALQFLFF